MNERTRMILFVVIAGVILFTWAPTMRYFGWLPEEKKIPPATQPTTQSTTAPSTQPGGQTAAPVPDSKPADPVIKPAGDQTIPPASLGEFRPRTVGEKPDALITLGSGESGNPGYPLQLSIDPYGAGLRQVVLNQYKQTNDKPDRYTYEKPAGGPGTAALQTREIVIGDKRSSVPSTSAWKVEAGKTTDRSVTLSLEIEDSDRRPLVRLEKTYELSPISEGGDEGPRGYEVKLTQRVVNITGEAGGTARKLENIALVMNGPTFPPSEAVRGGDRQLIAGYQGKNTVNLGHDPLESFGPDLVTKDYTKNSDDQPMIWIGAGSNYFNAILRPEGEWIHKAEAEALNKDHSDPQQRQVRINVHAKAIPALEPGKDEQVVANVFFGPRLRSLLNNDYYSGPNLGYHHTLEISGSCAWCTVSQLVNLLMILLGFFHTIFRDWGLAIIALVFLVRALLHPITKKSQVNMAKMAKMGPEIERIKKKYGDDKEGLNRAMLEFYKSHGATPILGCLPMFLQMPIWIALYSGLSTTFELRHEPFLYGLTWIKDLSMPDHLIPLAPQHHINFLILHIDGLNIIPILLAGAFYLQFKLQPKPPTMSPEQEQQQKMMKWMTVLLFPIMLYAMPSGLNIYILASTIFGVIESKIIRKHIDEQEALKASGVVQGELVDRPRTGAKPEAKKPGGLFGWFAELSARADQLRAEAEKKARQQQNKKKQ